MKTLQDFTDSYEIPYTVVSLTYSFTLFVVAVLVGVKRACCNESKRNCCFSCVKQFNRWLVKLIFGKSQGVTDENNTVQNHDNEIFINGEKLDTTDINILGMIIICFGLLAGITAYSAYLLEVTHSCSEDPAIYCYPQLIDPSDPDNLSMTVTEQIHPVTDCNPWINTTSVTFQCFRYALNAQAAIVVMGGLLAFFTASMRIVLSALLFVFENICTCCSEKAFHVMQTIVVAILLCVDAAVALVVMSFQLAEHVGLDASEIESEQVPVALQTAAYVADNGVQFLIIIGTTTLMLLLDWWKYAK